MSCYVPHNEKRLNIFAKYFANGYKLFSFSKAGFNHDMKGTYQLMPKRPTLLKLSLLPINPVTPECLP